MIAANNANVWLYLCSIKLDTSNETYSVTPQNFAQIINYIDNSGIDVKLSRKFFHFSTSVILASDTLGRYEKDNFIRIPDFIPGYSVILVKPGAERLLVKYNILENESAVIRAQTTSEPTEMSQNSHFEQL